MNDQSFNRNNNHNILVEESNSYVTTTSNEKFESQNHDKILVEKR